MEIILAYNYKNVNNWKHHFRETTIEKGKNLKESGHVHRVFQSLTRHTVNARCIPQTSINNPSYNIFLQVRNFKL
jgi:hypothetical protein